MIEKTFLLLEGIGPKTEKNIWKQGINNWNEFLKKKEIKGLSNAKKTFHDKQIISARTELRKENTSYFYEKLPLGEHWRLYKKFKDEAVFLDIETNGYYGYITVIGLYDGYEVKQMIKGINLDKELLRKELSKYKLIITFNGSSFDIPVINRYFNKIVPEIPHIDLRHVCSKIGLKGGLKVIEEILDIRRENAVDGMHGGDAVALWDLFRATGKEQYLQRLLDYNAEDIINLKPLAEYAIYELEKEVKNSKTSLA